MDTRHIVISGVVCYESIYHIKMDAPDTFVTSAKFPDCTFDIIRSHEKPTHVDTDFTVCHQHELADLELTHKVDSYLIRMRTVETCLQNLKSLASTERHPIVLKMLFKEIGKDKTYLFALQEKAKKLFH